MKTLKGIIAILLTFLILFGTVACSKTEQSSIADSTDKQDLSADKQDSSSGEVKKEDTEEKKEEAIIPPFCEPNTITLSYMVAENSSQYKSKASNLPITQAIQEATGVKLAIEAIPSSEYSTVRSTRLASGTELPDIMVVSATDVHSLGPDGMFVNLTPYIEKYATNLERYWEVEPEVKPDFFSPDGNCYGWPAVYTGTDAADPYGWMIRGDWLDRLGLEPPVTVDDWTEVFRAFKEEDANANGDPDDEWGWCVSGLNEILVWAQAWDLTWRSNGFNVDENGKVYLDWIDERYKEVFKQLAEWYKAGYIDPEYASLDHNSKITQNVAGAFCRFANNIRTRSQYAQEGGDPGAYYMGLPAPHAEGYKGGMEEYGPTSGQFMVITHTCKNPDIAFKFCDWVWGSDEGMTLLWFGVKGVHWEPNEKGKPNFKGEFYVNNPDGWTTSETALTSIGGHEFFPSIRSAKGYWSVWAEAKIEEANELVRAGIEVMAPCIRKRFPNLPATLDENNEFNRYFTDIQTYRNEAAVKFITGEWTVEEHWDQFVKDIENMNLKRVLEIKQIQYDRYMANK